MRRLIVKKSLLILTSSVLAISLTACSGAGPNAATRLTKQVTDGVEASVKDNGNNLMIANFLLVATADSSAVVVGTIVNKAESDDQLLGIAVGNIKATISGAVVLKPNQPIRFEGESANAKAVFFGVAPKAGSHVQVTLGFAKAGLVTVEAIIRDQRDTYADVKSK